MWTSIGLLKMAPGSPAISGNACGCRMPWTYRWAVIVPWVNIKGDPIAPHQLQVRSVAVKRKQVFTMGLPHTNTIVITAQIKPRLVAEDDLVPFYCSHILSCMIPLQSEASVGDIGSTYNGRKCNRSPSTRSLAMVRSDTGARSEGSACVRRESNDAVDSARACYNLVALHFKYDQERRSFVEWAQNEIAVVPDFHKRILFSDETHFWLNGYVNKQNCRIWSEANPQVYVETPLQPEKLTVWCALWAELWFQQDGATCHTARATIDLLKDTFGDRLISRFGPVNWPPRSCDLTPLDYFLWGYVKSLVYAGKPQTLDHLEDNIRRVIADIRPQMLEKVIENWTSRLDYIRASCGSPMPEIIFKM
ncbi:putative DD41D transposase [Trichonephila clavipes]|nr:putative DD41D transposase [Trichonephila clavipes]